MKTKLLSVFFVLGLILIFACSKENMTINKTNISDYNLTDSHEKGNNCMKCHVEGNYGKGWFTVAGTVYKENSTHTYPNTTVKLYSEANGAGTLEYTVKVDGNGNFYTTDTIDFGSGLYPAVEGTELTKYMSRSITYGGCNSCHGQAQEKIWTK